MNKPVYVGMSILDISKTLMYKSWCDYIKPKYEDRSKLCYADTDIFVVHIITEDFFADISDDVERWFDISNYDENDKRPLPIGKNKKVIGLFKDELGGKIMKEFCTLRSKTYSYLMGDDSEVRKAKGTKKSQQRFKSDHHKVYAEEVNKIALSNDDDKRSQTFNRVTTYPYGTPTVKVCENEMMVVRYFLVKKYVDCPFYGEIVLKQ